MDSTPAGLTVRRFSFDTAAIWTLSVTVALGAILLVPSAGFPFLLTKVSLFALGVIITLALYILARLTRGNVIAPPLPILGAVWLLPLAYGLSTLFSGVDPSAAIFGGQLSPDTFGFVAMLAFVATLAALVVRRPAHFRIYFKIALIALGLVAVVEAVILVAGQFASSAIAPSASLVGSFDDLGLFLGLGIALSLLAARFLELGSRARVALLVAGVISLIFVFLVNSTLVWILLALVALGLFVEAVMARRGAVRGEADLEGAELFADDDGVSLGMAASDAGTHRLVAPLIVLVVALFVLIGGSTLAGTLDGALGVNVLNVRPSWQSTFAVGGHAYATSAVFGSGPNTFGSEWLKYRDASLNSTVFWSVDFISGIGYIPTSFVTTGVVGALAWLVFIGALLYFGFRALIFKTPEDPYVRFVSIASYVAALYVLVASVFSAPGPVLLIVGFAFIGVFVSTLRYAVGKREWGIIFSRSPRIGFVVVFALTLLLLGSIAAAYGVIERYIGAIEYVRAGNDLNAGNLDVADAAIGRALLFAPSGDAYRLQNAISQTRMARVASDTKLSADQARTQFQIALSGAVQSALTATKADPNNYLNWLALGDTYAAVVPLNIKGAYENAKTAYGRAQTLNPTSPSILLTLAQLEAANKNLDGARDDLQKAISLKNDYTQAIYLLSQVEVQAGHTKDALAAAEAAGYFAPNDPNVLFQVGILRLAAGDTAGAVAALAHAVSANPSFANARYFLAGAYAKQKDYPSALKQMQAIADLSADNAKSVASYLTALGAGQDPFPATFGTLSIASSTPLSGR